MFSLNKIFNISAEDFCWNKNKLYFSSQDRDLVYYFAKKFGGTIHQKFNYLEVIFYGKKGRILFDLLNNQNKIKEK